MEKADYLLRIREHLHDPDGKVWDDDELEEMLKHAAEQYSSDTGLYRGHCFIRVDSDGRYKAPGDYLSFAAGWNERHLPVENVSADILEGEYGKYSLMKGSAQYVYEDLDSIGYLRFCPNPHELMNQITVTPESAYGIMKLGSYGIPAGAADYGAAVTAYLFTGIGDMQYIRTESYENIADYMTVIYYAVYEALTEESDFQDETLASTYYAQYQSRIAATGRKKYVVTAVRGGGTFY